MTNPKQHPKIENITPTKRCPKCHSLSLTFDETSKRIYCTKCGYEMYLKK